MAKINIRPCVHYSTDGATNKLFPIKPNLHRARSVFTDKTSVNTRMTRLRGRAPRDIEAEGASGVDLAKILIHIVRNLEILDPCCTIRINFKHARYRRMATMSTRDLLALRATTLNKLCRGAAAAVTDGAWRDGPEISQLDFAAYCLDNTVSTRPSYLHAAGMQVAIGCAGVALYDFDCAARSYALTPRSKPPNN